jgi:hypothetical protein
LKAISAFYALEPPLKPDTNNDDEDMAHYKNMVEKLFLPFAKQFYAPSDQLIRKEAVNEIADLTQLYKVFERC